MKFYVPINEAAVGESMTMHVIDTNSNCARTNKRILKQYFRKMGVPTPQLKRVMKAMGFVGKGLTHGNIGDNHGIKSPKSTPSS